MDSDEHSRNLSEAEPLQCIAYTYAVCTLLFRLFVGFDNTLDICLLYHCTPSRWYRQSIHRSRIM